MCIDYLIWLIPAGLLLDIVGFSMVVIYGHALFMRIGVGEPDPHRAKDGHVYYGLTGSDPVEVGRSDERRRLKAHIGVVVVVVGFALQMVGAVASIVVG